MFAEYPSKTKSFRFYLKLCLACLEVQSVIKTHSHMSLCSYQLGWAQGNPASFWGILLQPTVLKQKVTALPAQPISGESKVMKSSHFRLWFTLNSKLFRQTAPRTRVPNKAMQKVQVLIWVWVRQSALELWKKEFSSARKNGLLLQNQGLGWNEAF